MSKEEEVLFLEIAKGRDKIFRGDGRFKESIMILSEMLEDFDSLDVEDYTDLVKNRYKDEVWEDQLEYSCKLEDYMIFFVSTFADGGKWFIGSLVGSTETKIVRKISSTVGKKTRRGGISRNVDDLKDNHKFRGGLLGINLHNDLILPTNRSRRGINTNDSLSLPENESFHFDHYYVPSFPRPPEKPPDDDGSYFDIKPDMGVVTYHDFEQDRGQRFVSLCLRYDMFGIVDPICKTRCGRCLLIPLSHGNFDVIVGKDWLSKRKFVIVCHEKVVRIPLEGDEILRVHGERTLGAAKALMNAKQQQVEFRINLVHGATLVAKSPYRLAPSEMQELSGQLQELEDKGFI
ncbi:hypothetical protein Tco_0815813 [Tanacetum coccineum]